MKTYAHDNCMVRPLEECCCGLMSLQSAVRLILILHLIYNAFYVSITAGYIILHAPVLDVPPGPSTSENDLTSQSFIAVWCLAGLPLIITGLWALSVRHDIILRIYMVYLACTLAMDIVYMWKFVLENDACHHLPENLRFHGFAFACGATRLFVFGFASILTVIETYAIFAVWSHCEALTYDGVNNLAFFDLRAGAKEALWRQDKEHYGGILGYSENHRSDYYGIPRGPVQVCIGPSHGINDMSSPPNRW